MDEHAEGRTGGKKERKKEEGRKKEREKPSKSAWEIESERAMRERLRCRHSAG